MSDKHKRRRNEVSCAGLSRTSDSRSRDPRFKQLLHKARSGDEIAIHSLWAEFDFDYSKEGGRHDLN